MFTAGELRNITLMIWCDIFGRRATDIYLGKDNDLSPKELEELENIVDRLLQHEPIQYIRKEANFCGYTFGVEPGVLIPRPETEELVELIVRESAKKNPRILDIGTGSGCIAIALSLLLPEADVTAWDISEDALRIARKNNESLNGKVNFTKQDALAWEAGEESELYDIIVSNPPYITPSEKEEMERNVLDWEPELALFVPQNDPLLFYRKISQTGQTLLKPGGTLYFEINRAYASEMKAMLLELNYTGIEIIKDISGNHRIAKATKR